MLDKKSPYQKIQLKFIKENRWLFSFLFVALFSIIFQIGCKSSKVEDTVYLNHNDTVKYVGIETCRSCHPDKFETFIHTGMGESFDHANKGKTAANFLQHQPIYDAYSNFYYFPYFKNDSLMIDEYRLENGDTTYKRTEKISYIIGSGQHTNSHIIDVNGYMYQAPATWYVQQKKWDLPPGFEAGNNTRFSRLIGLECMSCHNALPKYDFSSENKFVSVPQGIDCERCHGPGELHVKEMLAGNSVDTSQKIDYTIVNPKKLRWELQVDACQRCHLQGNAVLEPHKDFTQFKPGMKLSNFWNVYLPRYEDEDNRFIMASHADRLQQSKCFIVSNQSENKQLNMTCVTCHNPHVSVKVTGKKIFNKACQNCHQKDTCSENISNRILVQNNCVQCHMPSSKTTDIPHVSIHDHYIRKNYTPFNTVSSGKFKGLEAVNNSNTNNRSKALAYLQWYDKFGNYDEKLLDSAKKYIDKEKDLVNEKIYYFYLKNDWLAITQISPQIDIEKIDDAWTAYRIAKAFQYIQNWNKAENYYQKAIELKNNYLEFSIQYAAVLIQNKKLDIAEKTLMGTIQKNPKMEAAYSNLSYIYLLQNRLDLAEKNIENALKLNPDYIPVLINQTNLFLIKNNQKDAKKIATKILKIDKENTFAKSILAMK